MKTYGGVGDSSTRPQHWQPNVTAIYLPEVFSSSIRQEAGCTRLSVWMLWNKKRLLCLPVIETRSFSRPAVRSPVDVLNCPILVVLCLLSVPLT